MLEISLNAENLEYMVRRYTGNSVGFVHEVLRRELDPWQLKSLQALDDGGIRRMSRTAGHSVGKSWLAGMVALFRLCTMYEAQTFLTSATFAQLKTRLYPTIIKLIQGSVIPNWFEYNSEVIRIRGLGSNWIRVQPWSKSNPESLAGLHCESPCLIADESSAIDDIIFSSWEGSMQHENSFLLLLGNPLYRHGELFDSANAKRGLYDYDTISCLDSSFTSKAWIEEMRELHGTESDVFRVRVLGQFPQSETEGFVPEALIRAAVGRKVQIAQGEAIVAGLDVARKGHDRSCLIVRQGPMVTHMKYWRQGDSFDLAQEVAQELKTHNVAICAIDAHGLGGPIYDHMKKLVGDKVLELGDLGRDCSNQYHNKRSMLWGQTRDWLRYGCIPGDKDLIAGGSAFLRHFDAKGREQLESKELAEKRGVHSPDAFDALAYSMAAQGAVPYEQKTSRLISNNTANTRFF